ncbi:MAG: (2Fe-2S)-binding protein [Planctomycetes bacterium]|nr:(2Fe-2S)-binding protein [Planctomycetota bacterium]
MAKVSFTFDGQEIEAEEGSPLIDAARNAGFQIPSMCYKEGYCAQNSCLTCVVKINGNPNVVPSCSRPVEAGMVVDSDCDEVWDVRKTALELILSDHIGNCYAPCTAICPAKMEIPQMLRQVGEGDYKGAIKTVKRDIPFPAILGRICPEVCEGGCRRGRYDSPEAICSIERFVGDQDLLSEKPYRPEIKSSKGIKVAIVGAGITGLTAAYYLICEGFDVDVYEATDKPWGSLNSQFSTAECPDKIKSAEVSFLESLGIKIHYKQALGETISLEQLGESHQSTILALGKVDVDLIESQGLEMKAKKVAINAKTMQSTIKHVFIAGAMHHAKDRKVYSIAAGKSVSISVRQYLEGKPIVGRDKRFNSLSPTMKKDDIHITLEKTVNTKERYSPDGKLGTAFSAEEKPAFANDIAALESDRCLHCDCRAKDACDLRDYSELVGASQKHYQGKTRGFQALNQEDHIHLDSGKCLQCGLCVQISQDNGEKLGLSYEGRGFNTRIVVPFGQNLSDALTHTAKECAEACPTGAISFKEEEPTVNNPTEVVEAKKS